MKVVYLALFLTINLNLLGQEKMNTYQSKDKRISILHTKSWPILNNPSTKFLLIESFKNNKKFRSNVNLIVDNTRGLRLRDYIDKSINYLYVSLGDFRLISNKDIALKKGVCVNVKYFHKINNLDLIVSCYFINYKNLICQLTFSSLKSDFEDM